MPNDVNVDRYSFTLLDNSGEKTTTSFAIRSLADNLAFNTQSQALENAFDDVTLGTRFQSGASITYTGSSVLPVSVYAQREIKLLVSLQDTVTGKRSSFTLGTFDPTSVTIPAGSDVVDITAGNAATLVSAVEAFVASPAGNAVTVTGMRLVGRNI